jgi:hypothetical protein
MPSAISTDGTSVAPKACTAAANTGVSQSVIAAAIVTRIRRYFSVTVAAARPPFKLS